jgi:ATP-binding cassette subfamily B protein
LFALATPLLFQQIIDRVIGQGSSNALGGFAVVMVLFMVLELIFSSLRTFQFMEISNRVDINLGSAIISRLLRLNVRYFEKRPVGELSSRLNELEKIRSFLTGTALTVVLDALFAMLYFGVMFFYSPILAGIVLGSIPLLLVVILGLSPITQTLIRQRAEAYSKTQSYMVEVLNGIQTVKVQNSELAARRNWEDKHLDGINKGFRTVLANTASSNGLQLISKTTNILVITVGSWLVLQNQLTLGGLIAFRIISGYVTQPILRLAGTWQNFQEVSLAVERLGDVVNQPLETGELEDSNITMPPIQGKINFDQVSFAYGTTGAPQLSGVSLEIPVGNFTGFVGQSGCGKSTLLKLIPRLYEPTRGKVLIDDLDVSKVELYSLRRQLGFVPQDCLLFEGSIYSNIAVADPEAETEQVVEAARMACAHEFIMGLPYGYSTPVGEKGTGLSGGQRQRIALARMLLQNPNLMFLDEATSALDVDTEQQVVKNLRHHARGRTLVMITHRLSTLIHADQIVMMHDGRIDSIGSHDELMSQSGRYFALYQQQFGG